MDLKKFYLDAFEDMTKFDELNSDGSIKYNEATNKANSILSKIKNIKIKYSGDKEKLLKEIKYSKGEIELENFMLKFNISGNNYSVSMFEEVEIENFVSKTKMNIIKGPKKVYEINIIKHLYKPKYSLDELVDLVHYIYKYNKNKEFA